MIFILLLANETTISSFSAFETGTTHSSGQTVPFYNVVSNVGNNFDPSNGVFACPVSGLYMFHVTLTSSSSDSSTNVSSLKKEGTTLASFIGKYFKQASNLVLVECQRGESVYVEAVTDISVYGDDERRYTSFAGALLVSYG